MSNRMSSRVDSRHDRKRGRSRSPERKSQNVSVKSSSSRDKSGNSGNFKAPPTPKDKITQILQGHATRPVNEEILKKDEEEVKKETKTPLSLEEMIEAKRAKEEELSKPKFLTKAERAKLALEKRQKEADEKRRQMDELREKQREIFKQGRLQNDPAEERRQRRRKEEESRHSRADQMENRQAQKDVEKEQVAIKDRYLGQAKKKKKVRKQN